MRRRPRRHGATAVSLLLLAAMTASCGGPPAGAPQGGGASKSAGGRQDARAKAPRRSSPPAKPARPPAPATVRADELGAVPVLMYHQIVKKPGSVYDRTPTAFRAELEKLAKHHYVPVTAADYAQGRMDIPAGSHPVVLTFDDSTNSQLRLSGNGRPARDCAIGILREVARRHTGFKARATLFVTGHAFPATGQKKALTWLHDHGFEIGNHTLDHANLGSLGTDAARGQIAGGQKSVQHDVPAAHVTSLALPDGVEPRPASLVLAGRASGARYRNNGVYLVGAGPAPSPYAHSFDPAAIPRIRSAPPSGQDAQYGSAHWIDQLDDDKPALYTSDGDPDRISYPKGTASKPARKARGHPHPY